MARFKINRKPPSPRALVPEMPLGLEAIIRQATDLRPELRHPSALDFARDLERFAENRRPRPRHHPSAGGWPESDDDLHDDPGFELATAL
jgi:hypothetical protein